MARNFDNADDTVITALGACDVLPPFTVAVLFLTGADGADQNLFTTNGGGNRLVLYRRSSNKVSYASDDSSHSTSTFTVTTSDGWVIVAASKVSGSAAARLHRYAFGTNTWTHEDGDTAVGDHSSAAGGQIYLSYACGSDIECTALWNYVLTDAQVETLATSWQHWVSLAPVGGWLFDQSLTTQNVVDWTGGGANQSSLVGTAVSTSSVPGWNRHFWVPHQGVAVGTATRRRQLLLGVS